MRKLIVVTVTATALGAAGIALAGPPATNKNGEFVDLKVAVTPPVAGTAKAPRGVSISFDSFTGNRINGDTPSGNTSIVVRFNKGFKENGGLFPSCKVTFPGRSNCSKSTQIGTGTAEAQFPGPNGAPPTFVPAKLVAYNGKPFKGKAPTIIFIALLGGKPAAELDFTVSPQASGPYGLAFSEILFPSSGTSGFDIAKFSVTIPDRTVTHRVRGKSVKVHLVEAPTTCNGSWKFAQINTFSNAAPLTATDSQPCLRP